MSEVTNESKKDLENLAVRVLQEYGITPQNIEIIQSGAIKTVWKIKTSGGTLCLKRLRQTYDKVLFSAYAQIYIKNSGGNVPGIILDQKAQPIVQYNDQLFVVYEWLEGKDLNFSNKADLEAALKGLAIFHKASKGYRYPENSRESSKFGRWPEQYTSMRNRFEAWKELAAASKSNGSHASYLKYVDSMIEAADLTLELIDKSQYKNLSTPDSDLKVLCHQDFGKGNAISTQEGVIVLDLDSVTYDFSARDLRKIIGKQAVDNTMLNIRTVNDILNWYTRENPMSDDEKKILYIDLLFPHWFHGLIKNQYLNNKQVNPSEIEKVVRFEKSKLPLLMELIE
ncbi:MAG: spore coat protein [Clostridiales bacterium GWB2_37_7]|nr:MAG: spore coat protein [Clostridiales bacterium GWB2_37_7]